MATVILLCGNQLGRSKQRVTPMVSRPTVEAVPALPAWIVEESASHVLYSNGLSINRGYETDSLKRRFTTYLSNSLERSGVISTEPAGIVFHTTESEIVPFEPKQNRALLRGTESVLEHVRNGRSYNYVIDRFGQVYRIVPESQTAFHAGHSIWASGSSVWIDLNESFLGVSFEAESTGEFQPSEAQVHSGRLLTEVLRARYKIRDENCVTHAQVSVNPDNLRIGYHTDWGSSFPFAAVGITHGYDSPIPAVAIFGFKHDEQFLTALQSKPWPGLLAADAAIAQRARREGITVDEFRTRLQQTYKRLRRQRHG